MLSKNISLRLKTIISLVPDHSQIVWDICCDHGLIGWHLLPTKKVIFNDQVHSIIAKLELNLETSDIPKDCYEIIYKDAKLIDYKNSVVDTCFIMVGIGADLIIKILENIPASHKNDFILCAHQYSYKLREYLVKNNYKLQSEILLMEDNKFYEIIHCHFSKGRPISLTGSEFWNTDDEASISYLRKQIKHFKIKAKHNPEFLDLLNKYEILAKSLSILD